MATFRYQDKLIVTREFDNLTLFNAFLKLSRILKFPKDSAKVRAQIGTIIVISAVANYKIHPEDEITFIHASKLKDYSIKERKNASS